MLHILRLSVFGLLLIAIGCGKAASSSAEKSADDEKIKKELKMQNEMRKKEGR